MIKKFWFILLFIIFMFLKKYVFLFFIFAIFNFFSVNADNSTVQTKCFETLKQNLSDIWIFDIPYKYIKDLEYSSLEKQFSKYYKNMSSFGIDIDKPLFEMRLYSFWRQTWYIHPPYSPYPVYTKSDKWEKPAKEYIIAEEYITKPDWGKQFLSCSFMQISANDLMKVKAEDYLYDWEIISLLKTNETLDYKAWYTQNDSFNYSNNPFVTWDRLFIYPKETQNNYFDRYTVADSFISNKVNDFNMLSNNSFWSWTISRSSRVYIYDINWNIKSAVSLTKELYPIEKEWNDKIFPLFSYYQSIENTFPEFAKHIALRWEIHFDTLKEIIWTKDNENYAHIWSTILDPRWITKYTKSKMEWKEKELFQPWEIDFYEKNLALIGKFEKEIKEIKEIKDKQSKIENIKEISSTEKKEGKIDASKNNNFVIYIVVFLFTLFLVFWFIFYNKKK